VEAVKRAQLRNAPVVMRIPTASRVPSRLSPVSRPVSEIDRADLNSALRTVDEPPGAAEFENRWTEPAEFSTFQPGVPAPEGMVNDAVCPLAAKSSIVAPVAGVVGTTGRGEEEIRIAADEGQFLHPARRAPQAQLDGIERLVGGEREGWQRHPEDGGEQKRCSEPHGSPLPSFAGIRQRTSWAGDESRRLNTRPADT
jgi:hypothetical protein